MTDAIDYTIDLGLPTPERTPSAFQYDPEIKHECVGGGPPALRPSSLLADRRGPSVRIRRSDGEWDIIGKHLASFDSSLAATADPERAPELLRLREEVRSWRLSDFQDMLGIERRENM